MAYLDPNESFQRLKSKTVGAIKEFFPVKGKRYTLQAEKIFVEDNKDLADIHSQKEAKEKARTWSVPIRAKMAIVDNYTGKTVDSQEVTIGQLPKITQRHSYIVDGNEWQVNNQFRLKSGVYTLIKNDGRLESSWNLEKGLNFGLNFDPKSKRMNLKLKDSNVPLYPLMKALGADDDSIQSVWGKEILNANKFGKGKAQDQEAYFGAALSKAYKVLYGKKPENTEEARKGVVEAFGKTKLRPDSTEVTLGKPFSTVDGKALLAGAKNMLEVSRGDREPDNRDSLLFKDFLSAEDVIAERLTKGVKYDVQRKILNRVDRTKKVKQVISPDTFGRPIKEFFKNSTLSERPNQMNPVQFLVGARRTTLGGEGGIKGTHGIPEGARSIDPGSVGFLDPVHTPENPRIGTILQMGLASKKVGNEIKTRVYNTKTGKTEYITPAQAMRSNLAFGDQYDWQTGKPKPKTGNIKVTDKEGGFGLVTPKEVDYIVRSPKGMFDVTTNMIPFLQNDQGNRTSVAARQLEQAVPLVNREAPLVQTKGEGSTTFEQAVGLSGGNSHVSSVDGTVLRVTKDAIHIKGKDNKAYKVPLYNDFPLNDNKSVFSSKPLVKAGDEVKKGSIVADTNFTNKGVLSLGTNLKTAYMPWKGYNFEDGVVISESAAQKLKSEHMLRESVTQDKNIILNKKKFFAETAGQFPKEQADKLDDHGVVKEGTRVEKGDILIGALKKEQWRPEQDLLSKFSKKLIKPVRATPQTWDKDYPGVVSKVVKHGKETTVYVKAETPAEVGDKIAGRHGNKGIIVSVLPDHEMPQNKAGESMDLLLNPAGVPSRINLGQVLETAAGKIAKKTGKPYVVNNFDPSIPDYTEKVMADLKKAGVSDTEELIDPKTKRPIGEPVLAGDQYILKLHHMAESGIKARSRGAYDLNEQPKKGPTGKAQSVDAAGLYALLAHGAKENIREMQTIKADRNDDYWLALQNGQPLPAPKVPFAYKRFESYLKGMGVNVRKEGANVQLSPLTDDQVLSMSNGELKNPDLGLLGKTAKPEKGGIFDEQITGNKVKGDVFSLGKKWSHFSLADKMPNPVFEKPIQSVLGLKAKDYEAIVTGKKELGGKTGPSAISHALSQVDTTKRLEELTKAIPTLSRTKASDAVKEAKYLTALQKLNLSPDKAYTMKHVPVLPPVMRPLSILPSGDLRTEDINDLYRGIGMTNKKLQDPSLKMIPDDVEGGKRELEAELYDGLKALTLTGSTQFSGRHKKGIAEFLAGVTSPKEGYFQKNLIGKKQDLSMRGVIVPEPLLGLDEVGIPQKAAQEIYKPFTRRRLVQKGYSGREADLAIKENKPAALSTLEQEMENRPVLLKRDPVLHKYGVQAFKPKLVAGSAVQIHPLATSGYNADFDGDKMSAYLPVGSDAVKEAFDMLPSRNLFSPSTGKLMPKPTQESMLGLYDLSRFGKKTTHRFKTVGDAARAVQAGKIKYTDVVTIDNPTLGGNRVDPMDPLMKTAKSAQTTVGRLLLASALPEKYRTPELLGDPKFQLTKKNLENVLTEVAKTSKTNEFSESIDKLKNIGYRHSTGFSFGLKDLQADKEYRDKVLAQAKEAEMFVRKKEKNKKVRDEKIVQIYNKAGDQILKKAKTKADASNNRLYDWVRSGARGNWGQFHQMTVAPIQVLDSSGNTVPVPIDKSYSEGLDSASYFATMYGARMGTIGRVKGTAEPGALSKQLVQTSMDQVVTSDDCSTNRGISMNWDDPSILDRYLAKDVDLGVRGGKSKGVIPKGTLITPAVVARVRNNKVRTDPFVRSPLKCSESHGICSKCFGLNEDGKDHQKGVNLGVIATQALGEPLTQMQMNSFHTGGVVGTRGSNARSEFQRVSDLVKFPKKLPGSAVLSSAQGRVQKVTQDRVTGGHNVVIGGKEHFVPALVGAPVVKVGQTVKEGDALSKGPKNPHDLLDVKGIDAVQRYVTDELGSLYGGKSTLHRRNTEVVVRALTNLSEVEDPGDIPGVFRGDKMTTSQIEARNKELRPGQRPIKFRPVLKSAEILPIEMQTDWMARLQSREIKRTVLDGAAEGWSSDIHGPHPIPGMAYGKEFGKPTGKTWLY